METVPLTTLLSWAWVAFVIEADNAFEDACSAGGLRRFRISMAMWANGLRCIDEDGTTVQDLRAVARAGCNLGGLERWGWITVGDAAGPKTVVDGHRRPGYGSSRGITPSTVLRPTRAGSFALVVWPEVLERTEQGWRDRVGDDAVEAVRDAVDGLGRQMPWATPEVHPSDGFRAHVLDRGTAAPSGGGGVGGGPEVARPSVSEDGAGNLGPLLGRALTRLTVDHEAGSRASLALAANGLRPLREGPVPVRELPARSGISKEAVAVVTGFLGRKGLAVMGPGRTISLTASGAAALEDYEERATATDHRDLRAALEGVLTRSDALSAGLVPPPGCWRGQAPYLKQTTRLLADPVGALPWHPMVLHRGGWPDGS